MVQPPDNDWYMDTGATSHMTSDFGKLTSFSTLQNNKNVLAGSGSCIPIVGCGQSNLPSPLPPLSLNNVLFAPKIIKNLVSVRKFTTNNHVSVEFDPFDFSVKGLRTRIPIIRCNSTGKLYPITSSSSSSSAACSPQATAFAVHSPTLWHNRLGTRRYQK